jgi:copper chaperone CopZ
MSAARSGVRFHTASGRCAAAIREAIGRPIAPKPRKAMFMRRKLSSHYLSRMITRARVEGMSCQHCVRAVFTALTAVEGIVRADVGIGTIEVEHDGRVTVTQLREAIAVAGYSVIDGETNRRALPLI